jgi:hypothetical protein
MCAAVLCDLRGLLYGESVAARRALRYARHGGNAQLQGESAYGLFGASKLLGKFS